MITSDINLGITSINKEPRLQTNLYYSDNASENYKYYFDNSLQSEYSNTTCKRKTEYKSGTYIEWKYRPNYHILKISYNKE